MNSGSGGFGRRRFWQEIAPDVIARHFHLGHGEPRRDQDGRGRNAWKTLGHAQDGQRTGFLAIRQGRLLVRTTRHAVGHGGHVGHRRQGSILLPSRPRRCHHRGGKKTHDREDREQMKDEG